ncbi:hypothetical protein J6590_066812 [Homalodisca vitripennis]|nr:hypothetical protein J6590_066812 [Homalodisca vitripennis]
MTGRYHQGIRGMAGAELRRAALRVNAVTYPTVSAINHCVLYRDIAHLRLRMRLSLVSWSLVFDKRPKGQATKFFYWKTPSTNQTAEWRWGRGLRNLPPPKMFRRAAFHVLSTACSSCGSCSTCSFKILVQN